MGDDDVQTKTEDADTQPRSGTPVTVLTGALGAGKTTLLRYVLGEPHGYRVAVIQNEFSEEMGIESPLITDSGGDTFKDIVELPNGCLCCSAKDGLISALDNLLEQKARFDYVLVEATGVADPESICEIFWVDEELGSRVYLDGVVTLVDCRNALSSFGDSSAVDHAVSKVADNKTSGYTPSQVGDAGKLGLEKESIKQVACADVILVNKVDLVPEESARSLVKKKVASMNPTATVLESTRSVVPLDAILGIQAFDRSQLATSLASVGTRHDEHSSGHGHSEGHSSCTGIGSSSCPDHAHHGHGDAHGHDGHGDAHGHAGHGEPNGHSGHGDAHGRGHGDGQGHISAPSHGIESLLLRGESAEALYDSAKVQAWLGDVLWEGIAGGVYRCKGIFKGPPEEEEEDEADAADRVAVHTIQGVGKIFEIEEAPRHITIEQSKLLFIGRDLNRQALNAGWRNCLLSAAP